MNFILYDLIIVLALLFFLWRGCKKGFVLTLCGFLAVFVAFLGASVVSNALAEPVAKAIEPLVSSSIHDTVTSYYQRAPEVSAASSDEADWLAELPLDELLEPLKDSKFFQGFADTFQRAVDDKATEIVTSAVKTLAHYVAVQIARYVLFILAFVLIIIGWWFLSHALDLVAKLPVLSTVNQWGGGAVGLCKGALIVFIAVWLLQDTYIPAEAVEQTYVLHFFATVSPLSIFL